MAMEEELLEWTEAVDLWAAVDEHAIVAITDPLGRITFVNDRFCAVSQYSRTELLGQDHRILNSCYHPKAYFRELWRTVTHGGVWHGETRNRAKDGSFFWVDTTIVPFVDEQGVIRKFVAINFDITERKRVEAELAEMLHLRRLLADLPSRFVAVQPDQIDLAIEDTQRLIVETLRLELSMLWQLAEHGADMALTHSWRRHGGPALPWQYLRKENLPWTYTKVMRGETVCFSRIGELPPEAVCDAETFWNHRLMSAVHIPLVVNGQVSGVLAFGVLDQERKWREDEIIELKLVAQIIGNVIGRQRAERREEQLRAELAHATRVATLGELAATLAHELNQPLAAILSNAQAARRFIANDAITTDELCMIFDDIVRDDKRAGGVVHNLRAMVSKRPAVREPCCINELVWEVVDLIHAEIVAEKIALHPVLYPDLPRVEGARVELQQLLMNLLINAVHAMKDTPPADRIMEVATFVDGTSVVVRIRDHGHGIPPERLSHIFDPFFTTKPSGLGMGLSICRRIIENHNGRIEARHEDGGGACFSVWLPIASLTA